MSYKTQQKHLANAAQESEQRVLDQRRTRRQCQRTESDVAENPANCLSELVQSSHFEAMFCALILANMILFGIEVQYAAVHRLEDPPVSIWLPGQLFNAVFFVELLLRIAGQGRHFLDLSNRWWNTLDTLLVILSVVEFFLQGQKTLKLLRIIRLAKIVRLFRLVLLLRFFRSLRLLIYSIANTLRALVWTIVLLAIILYIFGIMFTQAATTHYILNGEVTEAEALGLGMFFGSLVRSVFTLFCSIAGGISWEVVVQPLSRVGSFWVALFLVYICFTYFAVLNVVTGVFCQTAIESASQDASAVLHAQKDMKADYVRRLTDLFAIIDQENLGMITLGAFKQSLGDDRVQAFFTSMDLTVHDAWEFFKLLDRDETHIIEIETFVDGCLHLRGSAGKIDVASLRYEVHWMMQGFKKLINETSKLDRKFPGGSTEHLGDGRVPASPAAPQRQSSPESIDLPEQAHFQFGLGVIAIEKHDVLSM